MLKKISAILLYCISFCVYSNHILKISQKDALKIGKKIWYNESAGQVNGLTSWNKGEGFASLGIGHFLWYPKNYKSNRIKQSFPSLLVFLQKNNADIPSWLIQASACPWHSRQTFYASFQGNKMISLRKVMYDTIGLQSTYIANRLEKVIPLMLHDTPFDMREQMLDEIKSLAATEQGLYAMMDYVNFKGAGLRKYNEADWGLLQVLELMPNAPDDESINEKFVWAADQILTYRAKHSKNRAQEMKWLVGWRARLRTYLG